MAATVTGPIRESQLNNYLYVGELGFPNIQAAVNFAVAQGNFWCVVIPHGYTQSDLISGVTGGTNAVLLRDERDGQLQFWGWGSTSFTPFNWLQMGGLRTTGEGPQIFGSTSLDYNPSGGVNGAGGGAVTLLGNQGKGIPFFSILLMPGDGSVAEKSCLDIAEDLLNPGTFCTQINEKLRILPVTDQTEALWIGQQEAGNPGATTGKGLAVTPDSANNGIHLQGRSGTGTYDQTIWLNPNGGDVSVGGPLTLAADPTQPLQAATKQYVDAHGGGGGGGATYPPAGIPVSTGTAWATSLDPNNSYLKLTGGTLTGNLLLAADPTAALGASTKQYVDAKQTQIIQAPDQATAISDSSAHPNNIYFWSGGTTGANTYYWGSGGATAASGQNQITFGSIPAPGSVQIYQDGILVPPSLWTLSGAVAALSANVFATGSRVVAFWSTANSVPGSITLGASGVVAAAIRGSNITSGSATTLTISLPVGTVAGDFAVLLTASAFATNTPTGWTYLSTIPSGVNNWAQYCYTKTLTGADISTGNVAVTFTGSYMGIVGIVTFMGATGGVRESEGGYYYSAPGAATTITNTTTSAVINTDVAIYWASARNAATGLTLTPSTGSATVLQSEASNTLSEMAYQVMPGGALTVTNSWATADGAVAAQIIIEGLAPTSFSALPALTLRAGASVLGAAAQAANRMNLGFSGSTSYIDFVGPNTTTAGSGYIRCLSSDGSVDVNALYIDTNGDALFNGYVIGHGAVRARGISPVAISPSPDSVGFGVNNTGVAYIDAVGPQTGPAPREFLHLRQMAWDGSALIESLIFDTSGNATFVGTISTGGSKTFNIEHPLDKERRLIHACLEGPENGVYYRGEGVTENGIATITLPAYFEALTGKEGRTVMLTQIIEDDGEDFSMLLAASHVKDGKFRVRSSEPSVKFFWEVKAVRKDVPPLEVEPLKEKK